MPSTYYQPSGRASSLVIPYAAAAIIAACLSAWLYAWLMVAVPFIILNLCIALGFAVGVGMFGVLVARAAKVRNPRWMGMLGAAIGLAAWYAQWAAWLAILMRSAPDGQAGGSLPAAIASLALQPHAMFEFAMGLAYAGVRSIAHQQVPGGMVIAIWVLELLGLAGIPFLMSAAQAAQPFCEASRAWASPIELPRKFAFIDQPAAARSALEDKPEELLAMLTPWTEGAGPGYASVTVYPCEGDHAVYLSVKNTEVAIDGEKVKKSSASVLEFLRLQGLGLDDVMRHGGMERADEFHEVEEPVIADPPELVDAIAHLNENRFEEALAGAAPHVDAASAAVRRDANRLCALACARLGRWNKAVGFWEALFLEEGSAHNALQAATSHVMAGEVAQGEAWIARCRELNKLSGELPGLLIETNFVTALTACGHMRQAFPYVENIRQVYQQLHITDATFLSLRGVPFFSTFLEKSAPVVKAALPAGQVRDWYASMLEHLDASGREELGAWLEDGLQAPAVELRKS